MHYLIAGGTGFIGQALVKHWLDKGHKLTVIGRSSTNIQKIFNGQVNAITWQQLDITHIQAANAIINLTGANIGSKRWTPTRKQELIASRISPTQTLTQLCAKLGQASPPLLNASGVGIYGLQAELSHDLSAAFSENSTINTHHASFLAELAKQWEQATQVAGQAGTRVILMRFGVVLDKSGGVLKQLLLPYKLGLGGRLGTGKQPFAWIALADLCRAIDFIIHHPELAGPVNLVAPQTVTQAEFASTLCKALHRPCLAKLPATVINLLFGQMGSELLLHGQHVVPAKLLAAGFNFEFANIKALTKHY